MTDGKKNYENCFSQETEGNEESIISIAFDKESIQKIKTESFEQNSKNPSSIGNAM